jgi:DNA invertase Pin-like site-specific DNA recombinase
VTLADQRLSGGDKNSLRTSIADLVLQALSLIAQNERENRRRRQAEGIAAAKESGVRFGREPKPFPENFLRVYKSWEKGRISTAEAARRCGIPHSTFRYRAGKLKNKSFSPSLPGGM